MSGRKVANILFNDVLNTFYLRGILFPISSKGSFICHITAFVTPVLEHWLEREIAKWVYQYGVSNVRRNCSKFIKHKTSVSFAHGLYLSNRKREV